MTTSPRGLVLLTLGVLALASAALAWPAMTVLAARNRAIAASNLLEQTARSERDLAQLKANLPKTASSRAPGGEDLSALFQTVLRDAGLAPNLVAEVTPQVNALSNAESSAATSRWRRQSVQVRLQPMPLADIGLVLERWRAAHPEWTISPITLAANERQSEASASAAPVTFGATLQLNASSLESVDSPSRSNTRQ